MQMRYRYRIEPTPAQQTMLARVFGCARVVVNDALRVRDEAYRAGIKLSDSQIQRRVITQAKTTIERSWLCEAPSVALVQSVNDSRRAWRNFFASATGKRKGRKLGRPRFKSRKDHRQSFRLTRNGFSVRDNGRLFVAKVGEVRVRWSRDLPSAPSSVTIIREPDGHFYASFVVDVAASALPLVEREAGVDLGITRLATIADSDGARTDVANPKHLARKLRKLARLEREKSRRHKGSNNRDKSRRKLAVAHNQVARARRDYHHKQALALVRENQVIHVEDLNIVGMVKNRRLARAISDASWGSSCESSQRRPTATGAPCTRCRGGWRRARHARHVGVGSTSCHYRSGPGHVHAERSTIATTTPPKSFSLPGGQRDKTPAEPR
jgi:putative transposase